MGSIVILDENTANKIAAGEVIERPASVVKELVENSIDAGADNISIEIKNGGISFIKITDNGSGMGEDDVEIAFERHATSKIRSADDIEHVLTMGFRGEALASIAAVSDVQVVTRVPDSEYGIFLEVKGGKVLEVKKTGCPVGTTFTIRDLFFNTPARFKFLKKDSTEAGYVSETVSRIALGNPAISFRLTSGGSQVLYTPGNNDQLSAIFSIYGKETAKNVHKVDYRDERVHITGYTGKPEIARSNRSHQYIYINKRFIKNKIISSAVDEAYSTFLMKNKFPFFLLNIDINPMMVDVNVHPSKMEVKFSNEQDIFKAVYHAVNNALLTNSEIRQAVIKGKPAENIFKMSNEKEFTGSNGAGQYKGASLYEDRNGGPFEQQTLNLRVNEQIETVPAREVTLPVREDTLPTKEETLPARNETAPARSETVPPALNEPVYQSQITKVPPAQGNNLEPETPVTSYAANKIEPADTTNSPLISNKPNSTESSDQPDERSGIFEAAKIIGQIFSTYIILEKDGQMILIDQHAAHERIMYESLKKRFASSEPLSQILLDNVVIELTHQEYKLAEEEKELISRLGFEFEQFGGNTIILRSVPYNSAGGNAKEAFIEVLDSLQAKSKNDRVSVIDSAIYTIACKAAVKANKKLEEPEIRSLLQQLSQLENPFTCPHGRPSAVKITKYELEKMFKRIV